MYVTELSIQGLKCFRDIRLTFGLAESDPLGNWNVVIGDNGTGKTTLLQAIAGALMGVSSAQKALDFDSWVRDATKRAYVRATLKRGAGDKKDGRPTEGKPKTLWHTAYAIAAGGREVQISETEKVFVATPTMYEPRVGASVLFPFKNLERLVEDSEFIKRHALANADQEGRGWMACGYGSFRRVSGFSSDAAQVSDILRRRFLTLLDEGAALHDCVVWLKERERLAKRAPKDSARRKDLSDVLAAVPRLLPEVEQVKIEDEVLFLWRGRWLPLEGLSDGYRSMFVLITDILRWCLHHRPPSVPLLEVEGVVLVDEIDTHLHPSWQRTAPGLLTTAFPKLQFIVTTHSPFVTMAAAQGRVTRLEERGGQVVATQELASARGWSVQRVLEDLFGLESTLDPQTADMFAEYEGLRGLTTQSNAQAARLSELKVELDRRMSGDVASPTARARQEDNAALLKLLRSRLA